jgi:hypothetical protein
MCTLIGIMKLGLRITFEKKLEAGRVVQVAEHLPSKHKAPDTTKKKKKKTGPGAVAVIPATQEAEIGKVCGQPRQKVG